MEAIRKEVLLLFAFFLITGTIFCASSGEYSVLKIPVNIRKGAVAVVRKSDLKYKRKSLSKATKYVTEAITVLKSSGYRYALFSERYNDFSKIKSLKATVYDQYGNKVKNISKDDIHDVSAIDNASVYSDARRKYIDPENYNYPFTIEYSYEVDYNGILATPSWLMYPGYNVGVQESSFIISFPEELPLEYYSSNIDIDPEVDKDKGIVTYSWKINNLHPIKYEPLSPPQSDFLPYVLTRPFNFEIDGFEGSSESWASFGSWVYELLGDRSILPDETVDEIRSMVSDSPTEVEKISVLYNWMQNRTRYVGIYIGLGGWQPLDVKEVDKKLYGDCKALSNYMRVVLYAAGIESYYTLVSSGESIEPVIKDFPSQQFDHVILCVPVSNDTIWLECTNQTNPMGFIAGFTDDRDVLVVKRDSSKLCHTRVYSGGDNEKITTGVVNIDEQGNGIGEFIEINKGVFYDYAEQYLYSDSESRLKAKVDDLHVADFKIQKYNVNRNKDDIPEIVENTVLSLPKYVVKMGSRFFLQPNILTRNEFNLNGFSDRKNDISFQRTLVEVDSIVINIPDGYVPESVPKPVNVNTKYGSYSAEIISDGTKVYYNRRLELKKGMYPYEEYNSFKDFIKETERSDNAKVVFVKSK